MFDGFLFIDKPSGPTSHDVVEAVRGLLTAYRLPTTALNDKPPKVGHSGTLDPFATGLLIIGIGKATKELGKLAGLDKEYEATLRLGAVTETYDRTGKISSTDYRLPTAAEIENVLKKFVGKIEQIPPMYSAKKVRGKKLYELARKGIEVERKPITVTIYSIEMIGSPLTDYRLPLRIRCSSGTYIRTLAHDIGQSLGCGAYLEELRRTAIGLFRVEDSVSLTALNQKNISHFLKTI